MSKVVRTGWHHLGAVLLLFSVWTAATWLLEGRIETLLRPDAAFDRLVYALVANLLIGTIGAIYVIRRLRDAGVLNSADAGFASPARIASSIVAGALLGFGLYVAQGAPTLDVSVIANAYAQVWVVSVAEVLVCWAVVGATVETLLRNRGRLIAALAGAATASLLFGVYHFAHSAPFNTFGMVALLTVVGFVTSAFFFMARDIYGTVLFHNFLGTFGVVQALQAADNLDTFATLQTPLLATAVVALVLLVAADVFWLRRSPGALS
jgi:hypothetical protein